MGKKVERLEEKVLGLSVITIHKNGTEHRLPNYIHIKNPKDANRILSSTKDDGEVNLKNFPFIWNPFEDEGYKVVAVHYGDIDYGRSTGITFDEYVKIGRPKKVRVSTQKRITSAA